MKRRATSISIAIPLLLLSLPLQKAFAAAQGSATQVQVARAVLRVCRAKDANQQVDAAQAMRNLVLASNPAAIDDGTIHSIASLLDLQNEATRYWVVEALGHFGPRARFVSPTLVKILHNYECMIAETSSVPMIHDTLQRIGTPMPDRKCDHYLEPK